MPINPQLYVPQVQPMQLENPLNLARNAMAIKEAQSTIAANQLKATRAQQLQNVLAGKPGEQRDPQAIANALLQGGFPEEAKQVMDFATSTGQSRKAGLEAEAAQFALLGSEAGAFANDPSSLNKAAILPWAAAAVERKLLTPEAFSRFEAMPDDPRQLQAAMRRLQVQALTPVQQLETSVIQQDLGGETRALRIPKIGGPAEEVVGTRERVTASPNRPVSNIQSFVPASETAQTEFIKEFRDTYKQLKTAPVDIANLRRAAVLAQSEGRKYMGTGGQAFLSAAKFLKNRLGVDIDAKALADAEEARTVLFQNVLGNLRKLDAQPSQQQQFIMQEALGNLDTDPDALPRVVQVYEDVIRGRVEQHNREFAEMKANPNLANAFPYSLEIKLPPAVTVTGPGGRPLGATADQPIRVKTPAELNALPPGSLYIGPDGKTRRKPNG